MAIKNNVYLNNALFEESLANNGESGVKPTESSTLTPKGQPVSVDKTLLNFVTDAERSRASDILLVAKNPLIFRIAGALQPMNSQMLSNETIESFIMPILTDEQKKYLLQQRDLDLSYSFTSKTRVRINVHYQMDSIAVAMRLIPQIVPDFETLKLPAVIRKFVDYQRGLVLVTGPTGSGKSTTLASLLDIINREQRMHIITVEDPVEYIHHSKRSIVEQRELGTDTPTFTSALKHVLRQDPDVILVGEMRDLDTISTAITAAETGHLVFATLHTNDAPQTIDRIIDAFPTYQQNQVRQQLSLSLVGIVSQHLLPTTTGKSRVPAVEVLFADTGIRNLIRKGSTHEIYGLMEVGKSNGNILLDQSLIGLLKEGIISEKEAFSHARNSAIMNRDLNGIK